MAEVAGATEEQPEAAEFFGRGSLHAAGLGSRWQQVSAQEELPWQLDTAFLYYGERDGRVQDASLNALARKEFSDEHFLNHKSCRRYADRREPLGRITRSIRPADIYYSLGRQQLYVIAPGELPQDDTFLDYPRCDKRELATTLGRRCRPSIVGSSVSKEYDYTSFGLSARVARDFNRRNTTLERGAGVRIRPISTRWVARRFRWHQCEAKDIHSSKLGSDSKDTTDLLLGISQVLSSSNDRSIQLLAQ